MPLRSWWTTRVAVVAIAGLLTPAAAAAQDPPAHQHDMPMAMPMNGSGWTLMQDGVVSAVYNHQGGPRGGDEFVVPNWWMGMFSHPLGRGSVRFDTMLSLDPASVGEEGYREIFQVGEAYHGQPLVDRQHPHDFFMQLAAVYRVPVTASTGLTIAGGPAGEPALGPVAFMHRASGSELALAPLSHHTFDSTHIAFGVVSAAIDRGRWTVEGSLFNGREPDEHRWDFDFGALDSVSGRVWFKPTPRWAIQVSTGHLVQPEALEPGDIQRTTASVSWTRVDGGNMSAVTTGYGVNDTSHGTRQAGFVEGTRRRGRAAVFGRVELVQVETALLLGDAGAVAPDTRSLVGAFTGGISRDIVGWKGWEGALNAALTGYAVPSVLEPTHGSHPASFQLYFRLRLPTLGHGRTWNMTMTAPMGGSS